MDYRGLFFKFPVDRNLSSLEKEDHLEQSRHLDVEPLSQLCCITINSTYLESIDKFYSKKGIASFFSLVGASVFLVFIIASVCDFYVHWDSTHKYHAVAALTYLFSVSIISFGIIGYSSYYLFKEIFTWTHYPIRLNRKTRIIYVFRIDGTTLAVPWDEVYFTLYFRDSKFGNIVGHVLDKTEDKIFGPKIVETFVFSESTTDRDILLGHWEFLRRYMEEGPEAVYDRINMCVPVDGKRESFRFGMEMIFSAEVGLPGGARLIMAPVNFLISIARYFAMLTCKIPKWPREVEEACPVESGDPYIKDYRINPLHLR